MAIRVMKFGGTSVGDPEAIRRACELVRSSVEQGQKVVMVVSAMAGVTDQLLAAARAAERGEASLFRAVRLQLLTKHLQAIGGCVPPEEQQQVGEEVSALLDYLLRLCESVSVLGELTARGLDTILALGERMSCRIVASCLRGLGVPAQAVEATKVVVTDEQFGSANPDLEATQSKVQEVLVPLLEGGTVPVVTGYIGATRAGVTATLGRGGSDYSASLIGACLAAEEIWIWTDVDGVLTADPRIVPGARTLPEITYVEAAELAYFGAKVLHPKTMLPALKKGIPLRIKNTFNPDHPGTVIKAEAATSEKGVRAITCARGLSLITVQGRGMLGVPGVAAKVFGAVAREGISVLMISQSSSEQNICFVVPRESAGKVLAALESEFATERQRQDIDAIFAQNNVGIVAVVGAGMKGTPGVAARVFGALGERNINVICIAQGSSEYNLSFVLDEKDLDEAVRAVHEECQLGAVAAAKG